MKINGRLGRSVVSVSGAAVGRGDQVNGVATDNTRLGWFNVKRYGAEGNDSANDTTAIRNAITAAVAHADANSVTATVYFPSGTYRVANDTGDSEWSGEQPSIFTEFTDNLHFVGDGPTLSVISCFHPGLADPETTWTVGSPGDYNKIKRGGCFKADGTGGLNNIKFSGLRITGNTAPTGNYAVGGLVGSTTVNDTTNVFTHISSSLVLNNNDTVRFGTGAPSEVLNQLLYVINSDTEAKTFQVSTTQGGAAVDVSAATVSPFLVSNGVGWDLSHKAIRIGGSGENIVNNVVIDNCRLDNWRGEVVYSGGKIVGTVLINNSTVEEADASAISMGASLTVKDCTISNAANGVENYGIGAHQYLNMSGCTVTGGRDDTETNKYGIVWLGINGTSITVTDNTFTGWGTGQVALFDVVYNATISNNNFFDARTSGVRIQGGSGQSVPEYTFNNITISNNDFDGKTASTTNGIAFTTASANGWSGITIEGNTFHATAGSMSAATSFTFAPLSANISNFVIRNNTIDTKDANFVNANYAGRPIWSGNTEGSNYVAGDTVDRFGAGPFEAYPIGIGFRLRSNTSNAEFYVDSAKLDEYPNGYTVNMIVEGTKPAAVLPADATWNTWTSDITIATGQSEQIRFNGTKFEQVA